MLCTLQAIVTQEPGAQARVEDGTIVLGNLQVLGNEYLGSPFLASEQERIAATNSYLPANADAHPQCVAIGTAVSKVFDMPMGGVTFVGHERVVCHANGLQQVWMHTWSCSLTKTVHHVAHCVVPLLPRPSPLIDALQCATG